MCEKKKVVCVFPNLQLGLENVLHATLDGVEVLGGGDIVGASRLAAGEGQVLGHDAVLIDSVDAGLLEGLGKGDNLGGVVELAALNETTGPGEDGGDGVGRRLVALLVLTVVTSDGAVGSLRLECLAVGGDEDRGHETQRAEALGDNVGLDVTIVVWKDYLVSMEDSTRDVSECAMPPSLSDGSVVGVAKKGKLTLESHNVAAAALDHLGHHVVDETVLVPDLLGLKLLLVLGLVELLEDVLEAAVVLLEDGVLGAHVQGEALGEGQLERGVGEAGDGLVSVVLRLCDTSAVLELEDLNLLGLAALGGVDHAQLAVAGEDGILGAVLVTKGVTADDDGLLPAGHETGDSVDNDGLTEDGSAKSVSDGAVGGKPH